MMGEAEAWQTASQGKGLSGWLQGQKRPMLITRDLLERPWLPSTLVLAQGDPC